MVKFPAARPLRLSLKHLTRTYDAHTNTVPLMAHLTPETPEPQEDQMVDAGWGLVCELVAVRRRLRNRQPRRRARSEQKAMTVCCCMSCSPTRFPFHSSLLFCVLPTSSLHSGSLGEAIGSLAVCARQSWRPAARRPAKTLSVQAAGKRSRHTRRHAKHIRTQEQKRYCT